MKRRPGACSGLEVGEYQVAGNGEQDVSQIVVGDGVRGGFIDPCFQGRPLETLKTSEFLKLPREFQAIYIGGVLDGMAYVSYGTQDPKLGAWTNCVRAKSLGQSTEEVVRWLIDNEQERWWSVPWAVAQVIGARKC